MSESAPTTISLIGYQYQEDGRLANVMRVEHAAGEITVTFNARGQASRRPPTDARPRIDLMPDGSRVELPAVILDTDSLVHSFFELSYAQYLVIPRSALQSMPREWQERFVQCMRELDALIDWRPAAGTLYRVQLHQVNEDADEDAGERFWGPELDDPLADYRRGRARVAWRDGLLEYGAAIMAAERRAVAEQRTTGFVPFLIAGKPYVAYRVITSDDPDWDRAVFIADPADLPNPYPERG